MSNDPTTSHPSDNRTPAWLNALIVLVVLLVGLWAVYEFAIKKPKDMASDLEEVTPGNEGRRPPTGDPGNRPSVLNDRIARNFGAGGGGPGGRNPGGGRVNNAPTADATRAEGVWRINSSGNIRARKDNVTLSASHNRARGVYDLSVDFATEMREKWVDHKQLQLHMLAYRASNIDNVAKAVQLTKEQRKQLLALTYALTPTPEEFARLKSLITAWVQVENEPAKSAEAADALLKLLSQLSKAHEPEVQKAFLDRIKAIPTILSAEQLEALKSGSPMKVATTQAAPLAVAAGATTQPATRPVAGTAEPATKPAAALLK